MNTEGAGAAASAPDPFARSDPPVFSRHLKPHRSMGARGSGVVIGLAALGLSFPLLALAGGSAAWGMLPFMLAVLWALYYALHRSHADAAGLSEEIRLWEDLVTVVRRDPDGRIHRWHANPFWVEMRLHDNARLEKYLTLRGNGREIELGAFLSPGEREDLYEAIGAELRRLKRRGERDGTDGETGNADSDGS